MSLTSSSVEKLDKELNSCTSIKNLIKLTLSVNNFNIKKLLSLVVIIAISLSLSLILCKNNLFSILIDNITSMGLTISIGLVALIIAGYSIVMGTLTKENIYFLLLVKDNDKENSLSLYTATILKCIEPLLWFTTLLIFSTGYKLLYMINILYTFNESIKIIIKLLIISSLIFLIIISIISLIYFILNIYNIFVANARFELFKKYSESSGSSIENILKVHENKLNNENNSTQDNI
ncbi:hypothetical protein [Clostridium perfringens]|uniref:hypothetical protein n=1 Tax=Clostridium perfringens TaxID=1502 RepID=UPI0039ED7698